MNSERLLKLADYLERDTQPFSMMGWEECAVARCPQIWPEDWVTKVIKEWTWIDYRLKEITVTDISEYACDEFKSAMEWFGLTEEETSYLFTYAEPMQTREQTVRKIRNFVHDYVVLA